MLPDIKKAYEWETASQRSPSQNSSSCCIRVFCLQNDHFRFWLVAAMFVYIHIKCSGFTDWQNPTSSFGMLALKGLTQCSHFKPPWKQRNPSENTHKTNYFVFRGYKMGSLARNGLISVFKVTLNNPKVI